MTFHHYSYNGRRLIAADAGLPLPSMPEGWDGEIIWPLRRESGRTAFRPSHAAQVIAPESAAYLDPSRPGFRYYGPHRHLHF